MEEALETGSQLGTAMNSEVSDSGKSGFGHMIIPLAMIAGLFFIFGFVTWLNGSLMPYLELVLKLTPPGRPDLLVLSDPFLSEVSLFALIPPLKLTPLLELSSMPTVEFTVNPLESFDPSFVFFSFPITVLE